MIKSFRCQALDAEGVRCKKMAIKKIDYFGDSNLYDEFEGDPVWVKIGVCLKHLPQKYRDEGVQ